MTAMRHWLSKRADFSPNTEAVVLTNGDTFTFKQLEIHAKSMAANLRRQGIHPNSHVGVLANNSYPFLVLIHALNYLGAVSFLINTRLTSQEICFQLEDGEVEWLLYSEGYSNVVSELNITGLTSIKLNHLLMEESEPVKLDEEVDLSQLSHILYTSGTTGKPKGVQLTYGNHWWSAINSALNLGLNQHDRWLLSVPMFHVSGLSIIYRSVIYGMPIHLHETFDVEAIHKDIMYNEITIVSVVSVMLEQLLEQLGDNFYPNTFRCMLLGGGPASKPLLEKCRAKEVPVYQTYGMTETASQFCTLDENNAFNKLGSAGKPLFSNRLKIMSHHGEEAGVHEVGEIVVKGPTVTKGYYNRPEENKRTINDGWLKTGDLGYLDEDHFLYVVDRRKDLIISGGENIYPAEIEGILKSHPQIKDAGVVGKEDDRWGQVPVAFIVVKDRSIDNDEFEQFCHQHLAKYKIPKDWHVVKELPRNAAKKLLRHRLAEQVNQKEGET
ncbi:o-succinylbenzoate--CoA ligase [Alkalibacillus aidingensis]|uniref:o-succinylbenzoate--CoA ligase n=1 Tax=Alkalibacillus aidingensis TaxID=2747607 RepID=UPI001660806E|nr:o-succinylbenzoate--CoA ligase [Alkalibacillus aidingensis]